MILAGDVGGTKTRLALYEIQSNGTLTRTQVERFVSKDAPSLSALVAPFLKRHAAKPIAACFGIPGPVIGGKVKTTNLPWELHDRELEKTLGISKVKLVNDLAATIAAVPYFGPQDLLTVHPGSNVEARSANDEQVRAIVAPGTGLGQGYLVSIRGKHFPLSSEGGHISFAPANEVESELLGYLSKKFDRVSAERVLCGSGLVNIYSFLKDTQRAQEPKELQARFEGQDPAAVISQAALKKEFPICVEALDIFAGILGSIAGDVMLSYLATSGVYLGGGIPPKITEKIMEGITLKAYLKKGRLARAVQEAPLYVIKDDHAAILGAAHIARDLE